MEFQKLTAEVRTGRKKGTARRLRRTGVIPAVCYGPGTAPVALSVDPTALGEVLGGPLGRNTVLELGVTGAERSEAPVLVMVKDVQYHPVRRALLHADFITVSREREIRAQVPLRLEGRPAGVQLGGVLTQVFRALPVRCRVDAIPTELVVDVSGLDIGGLVKVADLPLPDGVTVEQEPTQTLATVFAPTVKAEAGEEAGEGEEAVGGETTVGKKEGE